MLNPLPPDNRKRNAYHEAGHVVRAADVSRDSIIKVEIGTIVSRALIDHGSFNNEERAETALAGVLAEARGVTGAVVGGNFQPVATSIAFHNDCRDPELFAQWLQIPVGDNVEAASFSDDDYMRIPDPIQTNADLLKAGLIACAEFVEGHWSEIEVVAKELLAHDAVPGDRIRELLP